VMGKWLLRGLVEADVSVRERDLLGPRLSLALPSRARRDLRPGE
jgi:hypothetical protein